MSGIAGEYEPIEKCMSCGSDNISRDFELEFWTCNDCGSSAGGANFWKD